VIRINLLAEGRRPAAVRKTRTVALAERNWTNATLIAGILVGVILAVSYWYVLDRRRAGVRDEVATAQAEVDRLKPILQEVEEFKKKQADLERKIEVITNLKNNQRGPVRVMDAVSRALPELLWLDQMEVKSSSIRLSGRAFNVNAISNFLENLDKVPEFMEPHLGKVNEAGEVYRFTIDVDYTLKPPKKNEGGSEGAAATDTDSGGDNGAGTGGDE
jgi:type IV pilus assembly protein PilN